MKPQTSARSAERSSSRTSRWRPTRNRHNLLPKKKTKKKKKKRNQPVVVGQKGLLVGLKALPAGQAGHLGG
jgi:hypothetical protein